MGTFSHSCLRGPEPDQNTQLETESAYTQAHWRGLTLPNSNLVTLSQSAEEGRYPAGPTAFTLHSDAAAYPSLLTHRCSPEAATLPFITTIPQVMLTLRKGTFIVSCSELPFQLHTAASAAGTGSKTTASPNTTQSPSCPDPSHLGWEQGPWSWPGKGAGKNSPSALPKARV